MLKSILLTTSICAGLAVQAQATEIQVTVSGVDDVGGRIGCALHNAKTDFPMGPETMELQWISATDGQALCLFRDVPAGTYAVSIVNDLNGNRVTDTNAIGLPTEEWGVSRNVRPRLRAPRFTEASFEVTQSPIALNVEIN